MSPTIVGVGPDDRDLEIAKLRTQLQESETREQSAHRNTNRAIDALIKVRLERDVLSLVLREVEWNNGDGRCPWCDWHVGEGHAENCQLAKVLETSGSR